MLKNEKGFTLIELLTVLVIIGIVLMITIPGVSKLMHNQNTKKLNALIDSALKASNVYIDEHKSGFIDNHDKYNFAYETLLGKNYVKEEDINCTGTIQATRKKGNNYTYKAYLLCKDKSGKVVSDNTNELPEGGISIQGKFIMDYVVRYNNVSGNKYDYNYTRNNLYNEFVAYDLERIGTSAGISKFMYSYDNKNWIELSANEMSGIGSFVISTNYVGKVYFKAYDMYGNESETLSYNVKIDKISPTGTITLARNGGSYNSLNVKATLSAQDNTNGSGVKQMCVQESSNVNICSWITYATSKTLTLSGSLDGKPRRVYAWFKDAVGNIASATSGNGTTGAEYLPYQEGTEVIMSEWSSCSKVCGGGIQTKTATDKYTGKVIPEKGQSQSCNTMDCCSKTIRTGNSNWGACSKTCGGGTQTRDVYYKSYYNGQTCPTAVNAESQSCNTQSCDVTAPNINVTKATTWVTSDSIKVTITDQESGVVGYQWTTTNTTPTSWNNITNTKSTTITRNFTSNQTMYIWAKDAVGNISHVAVTENKIDKTAPTITSVTGNPSNWTAANVTLTINASDSQSGLHSTPYSFDNGATWQAGNTKTYTANTSNIIVKVKDKLGNISTYSAINITKIDKTAPTITSVTGNPSSWTAANVTLTINASDSQSGLHSTPYSFDNGATWQTGNTKTYTANTSNIIIKVKDKLGNIKTYSAINITKIDKTAPTITSVSGNPSSWTSGNVTLTINASDSGSGLHSTPYSFNNGATWQTGNTKTYTANTSNIIIKVKDKLGNIKTYSTINITKIDKSKPTQTFSIASSTSGSNGWYKALSVKVTTSDTGSGVKSAKYCTTTGSTCTPGTSATLSSGSFNVNLGTNSSAQKVCVNTTDNVNQTSTTSCSSAYYIDTVNPTAKIGATVTNNNVTVTSSASSDTGSGINSREYKLDSGAWYTGNGVYTFSNVSGGNHTVYIRITDKSGRTATASTTVTVNANLVVLNGTNSQFTWSSNDDMQCACKSMAPLYGNKGDQYRYCSSSGNFRFGYQNNGLHIAASSGGEYSDGDVYSVGGVLYTNGTVDFSKYRKMKISCDGIYWVSSSGRNYTSDTLNVSVTNDPRKTCGLYQTEEYRKTAFTKQFSISCGTNVELDVSDVSGNYNISFGVTGDRKSAPKEVTITSIILEP